jgi:hypothetical protein
MRILLLNLVLLTAFFQTRGAKPFVQIARGDESSAVGACLPAMFTQTLELRTLNRFEAVFAENALALVA